VFCTRAEVPNLGCYGLRKPRFTVGSDRKLRGTPVHATKERGLFGEVRLEQVSRLNRLNILRNQRPTRVPWCLKPRLQTTMHRLPR
jgi:hypothetical protein